MFDDNIRNEYCGIRTNSLSDSQYEHITQYLNVPDIQSISYISTSFDRNIKRYCYYISSDDTLSIIEDVLFKLFMTNNNVDIEWMDYVYHDYSYIFVLVRDKYESIDDYMEFVHKYLDFRHMSFDDSLSSHEKAYRARKFFVHVPNIDLDYRLQMDSKYKYMNNVRLIVYDTVTDQFYTR